MSIRLNEDQLRKAFLEQTWRTTNGSRECLSQDLLIRAAARELGQREREQVASHLAVCPACVRNYRIVHSVKGWAEQTLALAGEETSNSILHQDSRIDMTGAIGRPGEWRRRSTYRRISGYALAASVVIAALLAGLLVLLHRQDARELARLNAQLGDRDRAIGELQQSLAEAQKSAAAGEPEQSSAATAAGAKPETSDESRLAALEGAVASLSRPQFNVPVVDLEPSRARGEGGDSTTAIEVPRTANQFTLILHTSGGSSSSGYIVEITGAGGKLIFRGAGLRNTRENGLTVALSRQLMPPGKYSIKLYGRTAKGAEPSEQYGFEVRYR